MRFVHVLSAMVWVGGQLLLSLLVLPVLRRRLDAAIRAPLTREVGARFGVFTVALFAVVLLVSGMHGIAVGRGRDRLGRLLGIATLLGSVGVVLLATALIPLSDRTPGPRNGDRAPATTRMPWPKWWRGRVINPRPLGYEQPHAVSTRCRFVPPYPF